MTTFHERIYKLYNEARDHNHRLGRKGFAEMLNVSQGQVNGWLNGVGRPDYEVLKHIAKKANVSTSWLIGETDQRTFEPISKDALPEEARQEYEYLLAYIKSKYNHKS